MDAESASRSGVSYNMGTAPEGRVTVKAPATSANMGPGFDCLGIALDIWNTVSVEVGESGFEISGQGEDELPRDESNLVFQQHRRGYSRSATGRFFRCRCSCHNDIPTTRGLGSSSAALVSGLTIGNELCGGQFHRDDLLQIAASIEGHPDNVAPAIFGGMQVAVSHHDRIVSAPVPVPETLSAVLYVPSVSHANGGSTCTAGQRCAAIRCRIQHREGGASRKGYGDGRSRWIGHSDRRPPPPAGAPDHLLSDEEHHPGGPGSGRARSIPIRGGARQCWPSPTRRSSPSGMRWRTRQ